MSNKENAELNELLGKQPQSNLVGKEMENCTDPCLADENKEIITSEAIQWATNNNKIYIPTSKTVTYLPPACYEINQSPEIGLYFDKIPIRTEGLLRFPQTNIDKVINEIQNFWETENDFKRYDIVYKRGILMWGPPGGGKSCTIQLIMRDVVQRNGVVIKFDNPSLFIKGLRKFREIQPTTPVVSLMEDIDSILERYSETNVLNILDGVDDVNKICFLATTNYPEKLGARLVNRPSRFDKRVKIGNPNPESRMMYFRYLIKGKNFDVDLECKKLNIDLVKWVEDTDGFSIAHLKELFVAVVILKDDYQETIETLASMKENISSDQDRDSYIGFSPKRKLENIGMGSPPKKLR